MQQHQIYQVPPCSHVSQNLQYWDVILNLVATAIHLGKKTMLITIYNNLLKLGPVIIRRAQ